MAEFKIGCGQITWIEFTPEGVRMRAPEEQVLAEIAQAGYEGVPVGPRGGRSAEETLALLADYGLKPAPGYLGADFWNADQQESIMERARQLSSYMREVGCTELYVAAGGFDGYVTPRGKTRRQISGHVLPEDAMTDAEFEQFAKALNMVGEITLEHGVLSCFHNHVGSTIETREEIDRLFGMVDRKLVFQGPDIGHLAWAGADVVQFCHDYASDIKTVHVKDIDPDVLKEGVENEWDYGTFSAKGIFAELGEGFVDFPAMFDILREADYEGWIIVETDVTQKPTALESATISRNYLRSIGY
jgi:inosose dehydratase